MSTHPRRRFALALVLAGTLAGGALAGPAMAAGDAESPSVSPRTAGGDQLEFPPSMRKAGGETSDSIIAVL